MPNFSIKFSYSCNDVVYHKTAIVRAADPECAKNKVINFYLSNYCSAVSFAFEKISVSSYNLILI